MHNKLIILALLFVLTGAGLGQLIELPAIEDIFLDLEDEQLYNTDVLKCGYYDGENATDPNMSLVQFNISEFTVGDDDLAILLLKANFVEKRALNLSDVYAGIALLPVSSNWTEVSDINSLILNLKPTLDNVSETLDFGQMGIGLDIDNGDKIFAFDVSQNIREAKGDRISFMLIAFGKNTDYFVDFDSREAGAGPYILKISYPSMVAVIPEDELPVASSMAM